MKNKIPILVFLLFSGCSQSEYAPHCKDRLCNEITSKVAIQMKNERELYAFGSGGGTMHGVRMLALAFKYYKPADIDTCRKLLVFCVNRFTNEVNKEKGLHVYFIQYPFKPNSIEITISLQKLDGREVPPGNLSFVSIRRGMLQYNINDPKTGLMKKIYEETYEEAVQKLGELEEPLVVPPFAPDPAGGKVYNPSKKLTNKTQTST
ncbi:MAG: hypothetical protein JSS32_10135 [Verrucomicrobia bacterium]|nr:hypothetical protein [Verrucomicrobiota bacterium]